MSAPHADGGVRIATPARSGPRQREPMPFRRDSQPVRDENAGMQSFRLAQPNA